MKKVKNKYLCAVLLTVTLAAPVCLILSLLNASPSFGEVPAVPQTDVCRLPGPPPDFVAYSSVMKDRFYRNLPTPICLPSDVVIKFFLTADGFVRDASVEKSSGSRDADLACLDAAYCASPLSPPPPLRMVPPPPPAGMMLPPSYYGTGVYHFTFAGKNRALAGESNAARGFEYLLIPRDVAFRYGGFFTVAELESGSNKLQLAHPADALENTRFQWAQFYKNYPKATKEEVLRWSKTISDVYLQKGATAWF